MGLFWILHRTEFFCTAETYLFWIVIIFFRNIFGLFVKIVKTCNVFWIIQNCVLYMYRNLCVSNGTEMYVYRTVQECTCFKLYTNVCVSNCTAMYVSNCTGMYVFWTIQECMCTELYRNVCVSNCTSMYVL